MFNINAVDCACPKTTRASADAPKEVPQDQCRVHALCGEIRETTMGVHQVVVLLKHRAHAGLHSLLPATGVVKTAELPGIHQRNDGFLKSSASRHLVVEG
jgi:hypothetical protein